MTANAGEIRAKLTLNNQEFQAKMAERRKSLEETRFAAQQMRKDLDLMQKSSAVMGGAVAALIGSSVKKAADFEASMSKVQAISGSTAEEFARQEAAARKMGAETVFSASESAEALSYLALAGF